ncbi:hypothetical protein BC936DRAFT_149294 [Jimgerdemannia flammicorona]|uniref:Uncharacterized protein n=1 Tax=Jimgerdemannia flammicorona TaxID=994334 RepID=A0A433D147_9FUNG|nr:hypothetical protein BC936DRAFT_149294 [Jimgerdemannia flammicorona]
MSSSLLGGGELAQIYVVLGSGDEVKELTEFGLEGDLYVEEPRFHKITVTMTITYLMIQLEQLDVILGLLEILLENDVDGRLENDPVVDGHHPNIFLAEPAGLATACVRGVHNVVSDEEEGLELDWVTRDGVR